MADCFDYIIIGAGSAGCVLASRLSDDAQVSVLLLEAGGSDQHWLIRMPKGITRVMADPRLMWPYSTEAEPGSNGVAESWARGRALGGSSSVNGMVYVRGQPADFDDLAAVSSEDWSWNHMGAAYKAIENHELGEAVTRGAEGPLKVSLPPIRLPIIEAAIQSGVAMGLPRAKDVNDPAELSRIGYMPRTIHRGRRHSAANAFLAPARRRRNLTVLTDTLVDRIEFQGAKAVAVRAVHGGTPVTYRCAGEVLLSAGALSSPAVLQRSGVGPPELLRKLGIPVVCESREVGLNAREHRGVVMQWRTRDEASQNRELRGGGLALSVLRYFFTRSGPLTAAVYDVGAWFKTREGLSRPDAQILIAPFSFNYAREMIAVEERGGMNLCVYNLRPDSTGSVSIRSRDPRQLVQIRPGYGSAPADCAKMVDIMRYARRLVSQSPLKDLVLEETRPGPQYDTDSELLDAYLKFGYGNYHACGTCRMGQDAESVVDPKLRVRGLENLRVVDTSVFPFMLSGNTNAPAIATAWRAADVIRGDR